LKLNLRLASCPLALVIVFAEASSVLTDAQQSQTSSPAMRAQARAAQGKIWKSETTGREYRVRVEKDRFYAEWVPGPAVADRDKTYIRTECRRTGSKWVGISRSFLPCVVENEKGRTTNWCHLMTRTEIESIGPNRIVGRGESLHRFDCQTCKILEAAMTDFVWVPKH